ncbi:ABC transporter ATP-binding protein [Cupriavidus pampae]|uniref:High-affinity branched-chain amino acid transport ATP-binding protein LivF n=1 Tax=Cupriavidus pampae TaxID=659251 RepID=A0ABM8XIS6_9BURK|nr:ABC transporter ATP-binding protein [Cupriavidus pampae]CAG9180088.1 High-affinity branched-chain amino acid transport ATP-binding protein LivF [Cupriavidus pampae]
MTTQPILDVTGLHAWYGRSHILQGVDFHVMPGEVVALIGRNGAGKTTSMRSIMGLMPRTAGSVRFQGNEILQEPPHTRFHHGLAYVFEERRIVPGLTVMENIQLGVLAARGNRAVHAQDAVEEIAETFPRLKERLKQEAATMSGGEQQMLAIARAMAARPTMIMLDEPSEGIMPKLVDEMFEYFDALKRKGVTILLVEQSVEHALQIADRAYIMDQGEIAHTSSARALLDDAAMQERYCSV